MLWSASLNPFFIRASFQRRGSRMYTLKYPSQSLLYQGFVSTEPYVQLVEVTRVSIPSLSGLRFNKRRSLKRQSSRRLNPFFIRASFQRRRKIMYKFEILVSIPSLSGLRFNFEPYHPDAEWWVSIPSLSGLRFNTCTH